MKHLYGNAFVFCFAVIVVAVFGCAPLHPNLIDKGTVIVEIVPSKGDYMSRAKAHQEGTDLFTTGTGHGKPCAVCRWRTRGQVL